MFGNPVYVGFSDLKVISVVSTFIGVAVLVMMPRSGMSAPPEPARGHSVSGSSSAATAGVTRARGGDCNNNGISDDIDLANCPGLPECDDCNVNQVLDSCDIAADPSLDLDFDGIPDACIQSAVGVNDWTANIWGLPGGDYPDNDGHVARQAVTLPSGATINLNTTVDIDGLRVLEGALLKVTASVDGNLSIDVDHGGILVEGEIRVSTDRDIDLRGGTFIIAGAGKYVADSAALSPVSASLTAKNIILRETLCGATDQLTLTDNMRMTATETFVMDGREAIDCVPLRGDSVQALLGGKTPPILELRTPVSALNATGASRLIGAPLPQLTVQGAFQMLHMAEVCVGCKDNLQAPLPVVVLGCDFENETKFPSFFDWTRGKMILPSRVGPHLFEVGGFELGASLAGFDTNVVAAPETERHTNYSIGVIEIGERGGVGTAEVQFINAQANTGGTGSLEEALYINTLILRSNSKIVLTDFNVYYGTLENSGATIVFNGVGRLIRVDGVPSIGPSKIPAVSTWGMVVLALLLAVAASYVLNSRHAIVRK